MSYKLSWYTPDRVLHLHLDGQPTIEDLRAINQSVLETLDQTTRRLHILIDTTDLHTGYQTADHLRETQKYMDHPDLESAVLVAESKLNRLITLMAFCLSQTRLVRFDTMEKAQKYLKRSGLADAVQAR